MLTRWSGWLPFFKLTKARLSSAPSEETQEQSSIEAFVFNVPELFEHIAADLLDDSDTLADLMHLLSVNRQANTSLNLAFWKNGEVINRFIQKNIREFPNTPDYAFDERRQLRREYRTAWPKIDTRVLTVTAENPHRDARLIRDEEITVNIMVLGFNFLILTVLALMILLVECLSKQPSTDVFQSFIQLQNVFMSIGLLFYLEKGLVEYASYTYDLGLFKSQRAFYGRLVIDRLQPASLHRIASFYDWIMMNGTPEQRMRANKVIAIDLIRNRLAYLEHANAGDAAEPQINRRESFFLRY